MALADESLGDRRAAGSPKYDHASLYLGGLDEESLSWIEELSATPPGRDEALRRLHEMLLRVARSELRRRNDRHAITGPELDDLAHQAADDALVAITGKLSRFRGESRFTTWAYRFVVLEVSAKLGRHFWQRPTSPMDAADWDRLPDRFGIDPEDHAQRAELISALHRAVSEELTEHQRQIFLALIVDGVPLDALALKLGSNRNAIYKTMFDARSKLRAALVAQGYLAISSTDGDGLAGTGDGEQAPSGWAELEEFLRTDPRDVGCDEAVRLLHVYVDLVRDAGSEEAARRSPEVAAHLQACGPCGEDFDGLLHAVRAAATDPPDHGERS